TRPGDLRGFHLAAGLPPVCALPRGWAVAAHLAADCAGGRVAQRRCRGRCWAVARIARAADGPLSVPLLAQRAGDTGGPGAVASSGFRSGFDYYGDPPGRRNAGSMARSDAGFHRGPPGSALVAGRRGGRATPGGPA